MTNPITIVPVILSGGAGSRLWPMSRSKYPKQFLGLGSSAGSLIQQTVSRAAQIEGVINPVIVSNLEHRFLVAEHMLEAGFDNVDIILEPVMRNTAPAITAAAHYINETHPDALMLVLPSDHLIENLDNFHDAVRVAALAANDRLVTFGIEPSYPETGYGYILKGNAIKGCKGVFSIDKFVEKPNEKKAAKYVAEKKHLWNSGMFLFQVKTYLDEIKNLQPAIFDHVSAAMKNADNDKDFIRLDEEYFVKSPNLSVDYAVMELTEKATVVPVDCGWSDAGAWDALWRVGEKDKNDNVTLGTVYTKDSKGCYLQANDGPPVAALGVKDLVVVSTPDTVLVTNKDRAQDVKSLMEEVKLHNSQLVEHHQRVYRPWGFYETIMMGERHQVKHIGVKQGAKLSVQLHHHRAEHWVIVGGTAKVLCGKKEHILTENDYIHIPLGEIHSIENIGSIPLHFIEVQHGSYLGEDDIVRLDDIYGRKGTNT